MEYYEEMPYPGPLYFLFYLVSDAYFMPDREKEILQRACTAMDGTALSYSASRQPPLIFLY